MRFVQVDEVCDHKLVDERCDKLTDGIIICDEPMDGICEEAVDEIWDQPVDETCVNLVDEICDKRVDNACDQPLDETCNKPVDEICDRRVDKICEGPVDEICDRRVDKICEEPVDEICFGQGSRKKSVRERAREERERGDARGTDASVVELLSLAIPSEVALSSQCLGIYSVCRRSGEEEALLLFFPQLSISPLGIEFRLRKSGL
jgi:hypothetical protein